MTTSSLHLEMFLHGSAPSASTSRTPTAPKLSLVAEPTQTEMIEPAAMNPFARRPQGVSLSRGERLGIFAMYGLVALGISTYGLLALGGFFAFAR